MTTPSPGDRRPREGRCERCDRPLTDEVFAHPNGCEEDWYADDPSATHCLGVGIECTGDEVDWRSRCLQAEAERDAARACLADVRDVIADPFDAAIVAGNGTPAGNLALSINAMVTVSLLMLAEARLSALFEAWCAVPECICHESWTSRGRHSTECAAWVRDEIAALAADGGGDA